MPLASSRNVQVLLAGRISILPESTRTYTRGLTETTYVASIGAGSPVSFIFMDNHTQRIGNKAWSYAHVLRDAGLPFHSYTQQITFLLFLKMADERTKPPYNRPPIVPPDLGWQSLLERDGQDLELHYRNVLEERGKGTGLLAEIF
jgi:HsdM-like protein